MGEGAEVVAERLHRISESDCCGTDIDKLADGDSQKAGDEGTESENV